MAETNQQAAERGYTAGQIDARLAAHDQHFAAINGSIARLAEETHQLNLNVQRLADEARAAAATVITTASALKDAEAARRDKSETTWTPFQRALAVASILVAVLGLVMLKA